MRSGRSVTAEATYITPRLGWWSASILCLSLIAVFTLIAEYLKSSTAATDSVDSRSLSTVVWLMGTTYGWLAGGCWVTSFIRARLARWLARALVVVAFALVQEQLRPESWLRHLSNLSGLAMAQCLIFPWIGVPDWVRGRDADHQRSGRVQFGIADIILATTCVALILGPAIRYTPPTNPMHYWIVLSLVWLVGPLIPGYIALAVLNRAGLGRTVTLLACALGLFLFGVVALTATELYVAKPRLDSTRLAAGQVMAPFYARLIVAYAAGFTIAALAARVQHRE